MIFAAGLGTRLRPLTNNKPKALVEVSDKPILEHVIKRLTRFGFDDIVINIHHFGEQIIDFIKQNNNFDTNIHFSDERDELLDTGGGIKRAECLLRNGERNNNFNFLVHNVDIISNCSFERLLKKHSKNEDSLATMLVSSRETSRYLLFDKNDRLCGWINKKTQEVKPKGFAYKQGQYKEYAFSGIEVINSSIFEVMNKEKWNGKFSIIDFYLAICNKYKINCYMDENLKILDIGKPDALIKAKKFLNEIDADN